MVKKGSNYVLLAGEAEGVTKGSEYDVYKTPKRSVDTPPLGTLTALQPDSQTTILSKPLFALTDQAWAFPTATGDAESLYVQIFADERLKNIFAEVEADRSFGSRKILTALPAMASGGSKSDWHIRVAIEDDKVVFDDLSLASKHGHSRIPYMVTPTANAMGPVLTRLAHFYWHLKREGTDDTLRGKVSITCRRLQWKWEGLAAMLTEDNTELNSNGKIELACKDDNEDMYGLRIISHVTDKEGRPLYCALFFFDNSDFSISKCPSA